MCGVWRRPRPLRAGHLPSHLPDSGAHPPGRAGFRCGAKAHTRQHRLLPTAHWLLMNDDALMMQPSPLDRVGDWRAQGALRAGWCVGHWVCARAGERGACTVHAGLAHAHACRCRVRYLPWAGSMHSCMCGLLHTVISTRHVYVYATCMCHACVQVQVCSVCVSHSPVLSSSAQTAVSMAVSDARTEGIPRLQ